ncbi:MAG: hypothetical protein M0042_04980 [Nitrospiraceae bacterium]|nr:hypothetical protein [Nitrospiraceae bacterium]
MRRMRTAAVAAAMMIILPGVPSAQPRDPTGAQPANAAITEYSSPKGQAVSGWTTTVPAVNRGIYVVRTIWQGTPLSDVRVEWRRHIEDAVPALAGETKRIGTAIFRPESGSYFLTAEWRPDGDFARPRKHGDRFAWFGGNPWLVSSENSEVITLILEGVPESPAAPTSKRTGVFGRVTLDGAPVSGAGVFAYEKTGTGMKADDFQATVRTNEKGEFALDLPPGRYYLLARLRADNTEDIGPLHKGDLLGYDPRNPVVAEEGRSATSAIPMVRLVMLKSRAESSAFPPGTISGRIVDRFDHPVAGAFAAIYQNSKMVGMPVFISERTGEDGRFELSVPVPGSYFLCARSGYGTPAAGSWFGTWDKSLDHSIRIGSGDVDSGIEIVVDRLLRAPVPSGNP